VEQSSLQRIPINHHYFVLFYSITAHAPVSLLYMGFNSATFVCLSQPGPGFPSHMSWFFCIKWVKMLMFVVLIFVELVTIIV